MVNSSTMETAQCWDNASPEIPENRWTVKILLSLYLLVACLKNAVENLPFWDSGSRLSVNRIRKFRPLLFFTMVICPLQLRPMAFSSALLPRKTPPPDFPPPPPLSMTSPCCNQINRFSSKTRILLHETYIPFPQTLQRFFNLLRRPESVFNASIE